MQPATRRRHHSGFFAPLRRWYARRSRNAAYARYVRSQYPSHGNSGSMVIAGFLFMMAVLAGALFLMAVGYR